MKQRKTMKHNSFEVAGKTILSIIVTWVGYKVISKFISTLMKRGPNPTSGTNPGLLEAPVTLSSSLAESSSSNQWKYEVFLSFRGPDTRKGITCQIRDQLQKRGIKTFMDDRDLEVGDEISSTLLKAIKKSRFAIVVMSSDYASSTWCLEELRTISECMRDDRRVLPLFYKVDPTDVRHLKKSFGDAFNKHKNSGRHKPEKVQQWKDVLQKLPNFSGWHTQDYKSETELVKEIVHHVWSKVPPIEIYGRDFQPFQATREAMDEVMMALKDDKLTTIGIYGMGGVGKTTLLHHIAQAAQHQDIFDHVIQVGVHQTPDLKKIQDTLASLLGITLREETDSVRVSRLTSAMMRKNKILIILDDVWDLIDLSSIGVPNCDVLQRSNSKVLLATRRSQVCHVMMCQVKICLNILSKEDSWTMFMNHAIRSFETTNFEDVARKVAEECGGLPIALIAVARALGNKNLTEWERAAERLKNSQAANPDEKGDKNNSFECIKLSYEYLKDEDSKSCFLLCCLFPEDYDIKKEDLFRYAFVKGLFREADTIKEARGDADTVVTHLIHSSLLLNSKLQNGCITMHDVVRDTAIKIASSKYGQRFFVKAGLGLQTWPCRLDEDYSAVSLMGNEICHLPNEFVCPILQILLLQENAELNEIPKTFFQSMNELKVLDLSHTGVSSLSLSLPSNLQGLYLDFCEKMIDIPILRNLEKLVMLSMRGYPLKKLSAEIKHLTNLRMLDVSGDSSVDEGIAIIPPEVLPKLQQLEELNLQGFWDWGSKVEGQEETNVLFDEVIGLSNLRMLKVCISDATSIPTKVKAYPNWIYFEICISRDKSTGTRNFTKDIDNQFSHYGHRYSRSLILDTTIGTLPPWFVNVVTRKTEELEYIKCQRLRDIIMECFRGKLDGLKYLSVIGPSESLTVLMNANLWVSKQTPVVLENLEELHLDGLNFLKELYEGEGKLPSRSLWNLKVLKVRACPNLGNVLLPYKLLQSLSNLEKLICKYMPSVEYVFGSEGFEPKQSKLREMTFFRLSAVRSLFNGPAPRETFRTLKSLFIYRCKCLEGLFSSDVAQCLLQLEDLFVGKCPLLGRLIETSEEMVNKKKIVLPKLKNIVLEKLPSLSVGGNRGIDMECPSLEHFYVKDCPQFSASASDFLSKNPVQLNNKLRYFGLLARRMLEDFDLCTLKNPYSLPMAMEKKMYDLMEQKLPKLGEKIPELMDKMPEMMENLPELMDKLPEFMKKIAEKMPASTKKMPEYMAESIEDFLGTVNALVDHLPEILRHRPEGVQSLRDIPEEVESQMPPEMVEFVRIFSSWFEDDEQQESA